MRAFTSVPLLFSVCALAYAGCSASHGSEAHTCAEADEALARGEWPIRCAARFLCTDRCPASDCYHEFLFIAGGTACDSGPFTDAAVPSDAPLDAGPEDAAGPIVDAGADATESCDPPDFRYCSDCYDVPPTQRCGCAQLCTDAGVWETCRRFYEWPCDTGP